MQGNPFAHCMQNKGAIYILIGWENIQVFIIFLNMSEKNVMKNNVRLLIPVKWKSGVKHAHSAAKMDNCQPKRSTCAFDFMKSVLV